MDNQIVWSPGVTLDEIEKQVVIKAYRHFKENKSATAIALGVSVRTIDNKLERYQAEADEQERRNDDARRDKEHQLARARGLSPAQYDTSSGPMPSGVRLESPKITPSEQRLPMSERQEIQGMLPKQAGSGGNNKRR